jgi:Carboxypeptidase regulatory-like domain
VEDILPIRCIRRVIKIVSLVIVFLPCVLSAQDIVLRGHVVDRQGNALPNATVQIADRDQIVARTKSAADGKFLLQVRSTGELTIEVDVPGFRLVSHSGRSCGRQFRDRYQPKSTCIPFRKRHSDRGCERIRRAVSRSGRKSFRA